MEYENPIMVLSAEHDKEGVSIKMFDGGKYRIPKEHLWHIFDVLRSHIHDYGAIDVYGRAIATEDI